MTSRTAPASESLKLGDYYAVVLSAALVCYIFPAKAFAYLGAPPFYVGELLLFAGALVALRSGCLVAALGTPPSMLLGIFILWAAIRAIFDFATHGTDALRDSVIIVYGAFAFVVIALMVEDYRRIARALKLYAGFIQVFIPFAPLVSGFAILFEDSLPKLPVASVPIIEFRPGDLAVHVAGAAAFALLGLARVGKLWILAASACFLMVATQSRAAMLAIAIPCLAASIAGRKVAFVIYFAVAAISLGVVIDLVIPITTSSERQIGAGQFISNITSVVGQSSSEGLDGTKQWRLRWWEDIVKYTFYGDHFWTGKGFGVNLAVSDGYVVGDDFFAPPLRSPHSAHMTVLARLGVPGLIFWVVLFVSWFSMVLISGASARRRGDALWANVFMFLGCYLTAFLINASFDVALEGPLLGIGFWCLFGFGVAASMIYRAMRVDNVAAPSDA